MIPRVTALSLLAVLLPLAVGCGVTEEGAVTATPILSYEEVSFTTEDGIELAGRLFGRGQPTVVLAHMYPADQQSWFEFAQTLADRGFSALTLDFRGYGRSSGRKEIEKIDRDLKAALDFVRGRGAKEVFLVGASMGGTAAIKVAAEEEVAGVIALSAPLEFKGISAKGSVPALTEPKLFIASQGDGQAARMADFFFQQATEPKDLLIVGGSDHGTNMLKGAQKGRVEEAMLVFLERRR